MPEQRFLPRPLELRCDDGKPMGRIVGYAARYYRADDPGTEYELMKGGGYTVVERLMPGAFARAAREDDVRALFNHDPDNILGRLSAGTLRLAPDAEGLRYEIDPPDTGFARDLVESIRRGDVSGSSFSFDYLDKSRREVTEQGESRIVLEVRDVKLYDVGPVTFPAYASTTAGVRCADPEALRREVEAWRAERLRNAAGKAKSARVVEMEMGARNRR